MSSPKPIDAVSQIWVVSLMLGPALFEVEYLLFMLFDHPRGHLAIAEIFLFGIAGWLLMVFLGALFSAPMLPLLYLGLRWMVRRESHFWVALLGLAFVLVLLSVSLAVWCLDLCDNELLFGLITSYGAAACWGAVRAFGRSGGYK